MVDTGAKETREQTLQEIETAHAAKHVRTEKLLSNLKTRRADIEALLTSMRKYETEVVYRFYHQSFKVFFAKDVIRHAVEFFEELSPDQDTLNPWFEEITGRGLEKEFNDSTNQNWLAETQPVLGAYCTVDISLNRC